ncbi:hypothetical protein Tco_1060824, partial [Tanacetum coccineum]
GSYRFSSEGGRRAVRTHMRILKRDFKYMYPSDFEDLYLLNLQGHLNHLSPEDKKILTTAVNLWTRNLVIRQRVEDFSDGTLQQIDEALDYRVKEFRINRTNPGMNARFWNLESFVGGRIREGDYRLLQRTE